MNRVNKDNLCLRKILKPKSNVFQRNCTLGISRSTYFPANYVTFTTYPLLTNDVAPPFQSKKRKLHTSNSSNAKYSSSEYAYPRVKTSESATEDSSKLCRLKKRGPAFRDASSSRGTIHTSCSKRLLRRANHQPSFNKDINEASLDTIQEVIESDSGIIQDLQDFENQKYKETEVRKPNVMQDNAELKKSAMGNLPGCLAVKLETNGFLDAATRTYSELNEDIHKIVEKFNKMYI